jgi:acetate kinase
MAEAILALNAGSSSIKFALFAAERTESRELICRGALDGIGTAPHFHAKSASGKKVGEQRWPEGANQTHETLLDYLLSWIDSHIGSDKMQAVGHRIVHGGGVFTAPVVLTPEILSQLDGFTPLAPLHQPHNLSPVRAVAKLRPHLPQIGCFDTAFHCTMPEIATAMALPRAYRAQGVRRYGFHGISYEYIARQLSKVAPGIAHGRVIAAHLGNGASLCALRDGRSVDTTMGFTALDGLMMGTRCGTIDAGVVLYMLTQQHLDPHEIEHILYQKSGLLGVSGISSDMRTLQSSNEPAAREAIDLFVFRAARETAALAASLGGIDGFVFTAGIGENSPEIRQQICAGLAWLGVKLGPNGGAVPGPGPHRISDSSSAVQVYVIPTDEEAMIVQHVIETLPDIAP